MAATGCGPGMWLPSHKAQDSPQDQESSSPSCPLASSREARARGKRKPRPESALRALAGAGGRAGGEAGLAPQEEMVVGEVRGCRAREEQKALQAMLKILVFTLHETGNRFLGVKRDKSDMF